MTAGIVTFNFATWAARYPNLAAWVNESIATMYFAEATLYCDNTPCSPVCNLTQRAMFLNMLTAHIAQLNANINGQAPSGLVGRISSASEGSVSVSVENNYPAGTVQWFQQTPYGSSYWAASAQFRMALYMPGPVYDPDPYDNFFAGQYP